MAALCLASASCSRIGAAIDEICAECGSLLCSCSASILTIFPFLTVTRTWAAPYCVSTASPVAVPETPVDVADEPEPEPEPLPALPLLDDVADVVAALAELVVAGVVAAVAVGAPGAWAWKASTPAVPAIVAPMTMGDRRMGSVLRVAQKVKDSKWTCRSGTPARRSSPASPRASASGPQR